MDFSKNSDVNAGKKRVSKSSVSRVHRIIKGRNKKRILQTAVDFV
jgi:hypothetical protein